MLTRRDTRFTRGTSVYCGHKKKLLCEADAVKQVVSRQSAVFVCLGLVSSCRDKNTTQKGLRTKETAVSKLRSGRRFGSEHTSTSTADILHKLTINIPNLLKQPKRHAVLKDGGL